MSTYPFQPGFQFTDTSRKAARKMSGAARTDREAALEILKQGAFTADEVAKMLGKSILALRPRVTELKKMGLIEDTGERRKNDSGLSAAVLKAKV